MYLYTESKGKEGYFVYIVPRVKQFCDVKFGTLFVCYI